MRYTSLKRKVAVLCIFIAAAVAGLLVALVRLQVTNGEEYRDESENSITQSMSLAASRGDLLDRYGRTMVTNEVCYNIVISRAALLRQSDPNGIILKLIQVCDKFEVPHEDTLPMEVDGRKVYLTGSEDDTARYYFRQFLNYRDIETDQTPKEIFELLVRRYDVSDKYTQEQKRLIVGVRYELELRTVIGMADYIFAGDVSTELIAAINDAGLKSVSVQTGSKRVYTTAYAAHLLGYIGQIYPEEWDYYKELGYSMNAGVGKSGAEAAFEEYLHGTDGTQLIYTNSDGEVTGVAESKEPEPGANVMLTIDMNLQGATERALESKILALRETEEGKYAEGAAAVVVQVGTGDVLTCASYPSYDINTFFQDYKELSENEYSPLLNRALNGYYEPGSTFKMVTATAGLESGIISSSTIIYDEGRYTFWSDYQPVCWIYSKTGGTHGAENVTDAIRDSCNYFFYEVGRLCGIDLITETANKYGLGIKTGVEDAFYESSGVAAGIEERNAAGYEWVGGDTIQAAIGQSDNRFTPIQLANYIATLAAGGTRYRTHFLHEVYTSDYSECIYSYEPELLDRIDLSGDAYRAITEGMRQVVTEGSVMQEFANVSVPVAAKTGTAQVGKEANNAIFVCFAPYDDPEIAVAVVVEKGVSGTTVASIAAEIVESYFSSQEAMTPSTGENTLLR